MCKTSGEEGAEGTFEVQTLFQALADFPCFSLSRHYFHFPMEKPGNQEVGLPGPLHKQQVGSQDWNPGLPDSNPGVFPVSSWESGSN